MNNTEGLTNEDIRELIVGQLKSHGIDAELVEVVVTKGPKVTLRGDVDSLREKELINQIIIDEVGISKIRNELEVFDDIYSDLDDNYKDQDEFFDEDNEYIGTEDVFRSVEDGIPYIPPTTASFEEEEKSKKRRRRKYH